MATMTIVTANGDMMNAYQRNRLGTRRSWRNQNQTKVVRMRIEPLRPVLFFILVILQLQLPSILGQNPEVNTRVVDCPNSDPPLEGYTTLRDIIDDQFDEWQRIQAGLIPEPRPPYFFRLCPNTVFDVSTAGPQQQPTALSVLLSGSVFSCGPSMTLADNCIFQGTGEAGFEQILIQDSTIPGYTLERTSFMGISFQEFGFASTNAFASSSNTTATFVNCQWQNFEESTFVINIGSEDGIVTGERMKVEITGGSAVKDASGGSLFSNNAGTLTVQDFTATNITANSIFAASNGGINMLDQMTVSDSDVGSVSFTGPGATTSFQSGEVFAMRSVENSIVEVRGEGATLTMSGVDIHDNIPRDDSSFLSGIVVLQGASATIENSFFRQNENVLFGFASRANGTMELTGVQLQDNLGPPTEGLVSALLYSDDQGILINRHLQFRSNYVFTGHLFSLFQGRMETYMTCIDSGGGTFAVFQCDGCTITDGGDNYITPDFVDESPCNSGRGFAALENMNSGCYNAENPNECLFDCAIFGDATECRATMSPTVALTTSPTILQGPSGGGTNGSACEPVFSPEVNSRIVDCPNSSPPMMGYISLQDIMNDQNEEAQRIQNSTVEARPPYNFRFCPNTTFEVSTAPLSVILSGSVFSCGPNTTSSDNCVIRGTSQMGSEQVLIDDSNIPGYTLERTSFVGITFEGFAGLTSINAHASSTTTALFVDTKWQNFDGANFTIKVGTEDGFYRGERLKVNIRGGSILQNGRGETLFSNEGGTITFEDFTASNITANTIFSTSIRGTTEIGRTAISDSDVGSVSVTEEAATTIIRNSEVFALRSVQEAIFNVRGEGATLNMTAVDIHDNLLSFFNGLVAVQGTIVNVKRSFFRRNEGVLFGFATRLNSVMELVDVQYEGNVGAAGLVVAVLAYSDSGSDMILRHVQYRDNVDFTGHILSLFQGRIEVYNTCIESGGGENPVFQCDGCTVTEGEGNYINHEAFASTGCNDPVVGRLAIENAGSGCYNEENDNPCDYDCAPYGTATECVATMAPTQVPTLSPSEAPTTPPNLIGSDCGENGGDSGLPPTVEDDKTSTPTTISTPAPSIIGARPPYYYRTLIPTLPTDAIKPPIAVGIEKSRSGKSGKRGKRKTGKSLSRIGTGKSRSSNSGKGGKGGKGGSKGSYSRSYYHDEVSEHPDSEEQQNSFPSTFMSNTPVQGSVRETNDRESYLLSGKWTTISPKVSPPPTATPIGEEDLSTKTVPESAPTSSSYSYLETLSRVSKPQSTIPKNNHYHFRNAADSPSPSLPSSNSYLESLSRNEPPPQPSPSPTNYHHLFRNSRKLGEGLREELKQDEGIPN